MNLKYSISHLTKHIKAEALRLGFYAVGISKAMPVDSETARLYCEWIANQGHATMSYMAVNVEKRLNPQLLMPGVESIISVALNYTPKQFIPSDEYQFAAYAYGKDYHDIVKAKLFKLQESIKKYFCQIKAPASLDFEGIEMRCFCDTAPVLERYWAVRSGIGWIGKNHQLIIPHAGSMFFLGELFINQKLSYDQPILSRCGNCKLCVDNCPTNNLDTDNRFFNSCRCLSYQTIEHRGETPANIVPFLGNCIYGCDKCQLHCPHNKYSTPTKEPLLQPSQQFMNMKKADWENISIDCYRQLFKGSAVKRAKYEGLMRNINNVKCKKKNSIS